MLSIYLSLIDDDDDKDRFEELYKKYRIGMYKIAFSILHNNEDAEDAVHEAFLCIANKFQKISRLMCQEIKSYLVIIIRNVSLDIYRKNKRISEHSETLEDKDIVVNIDYFENVEYDDLLAAISELTPEYKDVMFLHYNEELTAKEIAKLLDISTSAVWKRLERARKLLKTDLEKGGIYV